MGKGLPIAGILGAVFAALVVTVLVDAALFLVLPILLAGSIVLVMERTTEGTLGGIVVLLLAVLAAMGMAGSVTTKDSGTTDFGMAEATGRLWAMAGCLAIAGGAAVTRREDFEAAWVKYAAFGLPVVALLVAFLQRANFADQSSVGGLLAGVLALACAGPLVALLRADPESGGA